MHCQQNHSAAWVGHRVGAKDLCGFYRGTTEALLPGPYRPVRHAQRREDVFGAFFPIVFLIPQEELENVILVHINLYF